MNDSDVQEFKLLAQGIAKTLVVDFNYFCIYEILYKSSIFKCISVTGTLIHEVLKLVKLVY